MPDSFHTCIYWEVVTNQVVEVTCSVNVSRSLSPHTQPLSPVYAQHALVQTAIAAGMGSTSWFSSPSLISLLPLLGIPNANNRGHNCAPDMPSFSGRIGEPLG